MSDNYEGIIKTHKEKEENAVLPEELLLNSLLLYEDESFEEDCNIIMPPGDEAPVQENQTVQQVQLDNYLKLNIEFDSTEQENYYQYMRKETREYLTRRQICIENLRNKPKPKILSSLPKENLNLKITPKIKLNLILKRKSNTKIWLNNKNTYKFVRTGYCRQIKILERKISKPIVKKAGLDSNSIKQDGKPDKKNIIVSKRKSLYNPKIFKVLANKNKAKVTFKKILNNNSKKTDKKISLLPIKTMNKIEKLNKKVLDINSQKHSCCIKNNILQKLELSMKMENNQRKKPDKFAMKL